MSKHPARLPEILQTNLGLFFDRPPLNIPLRGLKDGNNFRIKLGKINNLNLGWDLFGNFAALSGPVVMIDQFFFRNGGQKLIFATTKDVYEYQEGDGTVDFMTPIYTTGTIAVTNASTAVTGTGTTWTTNLKIGDEIYVGVAGETDPEGTLNGGWYEIATIPGNTSLTLTVAFTGSTDSGLVYTGRKVFTGTIFDLWTSTTFFDAQPQDEDTWYATNGVDDIYKWDGSTAQIVDAGLTFTCKSMAVYKNMMIYAHIIEDGGEIKPTSIKNSDVSKPEDLAGGLAAEFVVSDAVDPLTLVTSLADDLVLYSQRAIVLAQFVGDPLGFVFRTAVSGIGPISGRAVADFGDFHEFLGPDSMYTFDGVTLRETSTHIWREVLRAKSPNRLDLTFSHFDEENGELIWAVPLTSDVNLPTENTGRSAFVEHYLEEVGERVDTVPHSKRDFPFTATGFFERAATLTWDQISTTWALQDFKWNDQFFEAAFPFSLAGAEDGRIYTLSTSSTQNGTAAVSFVRYGRVALSRGRAKNLLKRIYPYTTEFPAATGYTLDISIHMADTLAGTTTLIGPQPYDITGTQEDHFISVFRKGRYVELEFGTPGPSEGWEIEGYDMDIGSGGRR